MKKYSYKELEAKFAELGYQWPTLHVIGVRSKANEKNKFDDTFYLVNGPMMQLVAIDAYPASNVRGESCVFNPKKPGA